MRSMLTRTVLRMTASVVVYCTFLGVVAGVTAIAAERTLELQERNGALLLNVESRRPLADALLLLIDRSGYIVSYEDPQLTYVEDTEDVSSLVRKDLAKYPTGKAPKVLVPVRGRISTTLTSGDADSVLRQLIRAQASSGTLGRFQLERDGNRFHVVPAEARGADGNWEPRESVLGVRVSVNASGVTGTELIARICAVISATSGQKVTPGIAGFSANTVDGVPQRFDFVAKNESARVVLGRALDLLGQNQDPLTWLLYFSAIGPERSYYLNIRPVTTRASVTRTQPANQTGNTGSPSSVPIP